MSSDEEVRAAEDASAVAADAVADDPSNGEKDSGSDGAEAKEGECKRERKERKERPAPRPAVPIKVGELRPGTSGHDVTVKVLAHKTVVDRPRGDGSNLLIAESVVGDDTGVIVFTARGKQVDALKEGAVLELRNAKVSGSFGLRARAAAGRARLRKPV